MLTKKKWALFSLLTLCGGTIYKLPSLKDAFYIPMQEYFHLTNGNDSNLLIVFYVQIMPDDFVMQLHRF